MYKERHKKLKRFVKPVIFLALAGVILCLSSYYNLAEKFMNALPKLQGLVNQRPVLVMLAYVFAAAAGCVVLALPGAAFAVIAGLLFEPVSGTLLCLTAATLGAVLSFLTGRYFLRDSVRPMLEKNLTLKKFLFDDANHTGIILLMVTRLIPLFPYNLQNFAYGLTDIKLLPYTLYSFIFMAPGAAVFTLGAAGIGDRERRELYFILAGVLILIIASVGFVLRKKFIRR